MSTDTGTLAQRLGAHLGDKIAAVHEWRGETIIDVVPENWLAVGQQLRDAAEFRFEQLIDLCGVDYLGYGQVEWDTADVTSTGFSRGVEGEAAGRFDWAHRPRTGAGHKRFAAIVQLTSIAHNARVRLRCHAPDDALPVIPSLVPLWPAANWFEREAFDLFGIVFEGHPDLRRLLTDYGFVGHPFRKDFPLIGNVEVRFDEKLGRVIYEPVTSVVPRVTVPRVLRDDSDLMQARAEAADKWREN
ncbi:MAG: NADH-quinone oxidoreductase subunit C [Proteobacteria bacterium]|nr:NADH-quinone oxidoreductase subunit C [Pseudomonadota bacterium]